MLVREKGKKGAEPFHMDFGQAQSALQSGAYEEVISEDGEPGPNIYHGVVGDDPLPGDGEVNRSATVPDPKPEPGKADAAKSDAPKAGDSKPAAAKGR